MWSGISFRCDNCSPSCTRLQLLPTQKRPRPASVSVAEVVVVSVTVVWQFIRMRQMQFLRRGANRDCQKMPKANSLLASLGSCSRGGSGLRLRSVELTKTACCAVNLARVHVELALKQLVCWASSAAYRGRSHVCNIEIPFDKAETVKPSCMQCFPRTKSI